MRVVDNIIYLDNFTEACNVYYYPFADGFDSGGEKCAYYAGVWDMSMSDALAKKLVLGFANPSIEAQHKAAAQFVKAEQLVYNQTVNEKPTGRQDLKRHSKGASEMTQANGIMGGMAAMMNPQRIMDRMFRRANNVVWDLMTGKTGIRTKDGIVTLEIEHTAANPAATPPVEESYSFQTSENPFDSMGMEVPAFAQQTALAAVKIGDLILRGSGDEAGWVTAINAKSVTIIKANGSHATFTPPKTQILDLGTGVMVVRSLFNMLPNGQAGMANIAQMMPMLMMMGGDDEDGGMLESMMPMMLMMQGAGQTSGVADAAANPMADMGSNMAQMMPMMMMAQMMKKSKGGRQGFSGFGTSPFNK